ncbi:hypothetical protein QJS10_CPB20g01434 [Acorus calamus]|uniref:Uncharacterized protein n=1 Tax=Acorus calamus TaxID=4465 RepID=A0AAV9CAI5_ACOCL|nr:hypothetical protein QJS10_CPB20g01434 [Acorus calamus]
MEHQKAFSDVGRWWFPWRPCSRVDWKVVIVMVALVTTTAAVFARRRSSLPSLPPPSVPPPTTVIGLRRCLCLLRRSPSGFFRPCPLSWCNHRLLKSL